MKRLLEVIGVATAFITVVLLLMSVETPVSGGAQAPESSPTAKHTSWDEPNLEGIWTSDYQTPLERPAQFEDKEFFTDEERTAIDSERARLLGQYRETGRRSPRGSEQDVGGAYDATIFLTHKHVGRRTSLIVDPPNGRRPPFTPEAQQRRTETREYNLALLQSTDACKSNRPGCPPYGPPSPRRAESPPHYLTRSANRANGPEDRSLSERCMAGGLPDFGSITGFFLQIIQSPGTVSIFYDTGQGQGWQRTIPITDHPHLPPSVRQWQGDSRGHWDNDTLVVDVTNFSPKTDFHGSREHLHLVERWTRLDAETIGYSATMDDPTTWTSPWTVELELNLQSNVANRIYHEPRCHEGNYGLPGLLAGARAEDRAFAEGRGPDPATLCIAGPTGACGGFAFGFAESGTETDPLRR